MMAMERLSPRIVVKSFISKDIELHEEVLSTNTKHVWFARDVAKKRDLVVKAVKSDISLPSVNDIHRLWVSVAKTNDSMKGLLASFVTYALSSQFRITVIERCCMTMEAFMRSPLAFPMMENQVRAIGIQVISGIDFLHRSGIIHTNITPGNVALINNEMLECVDYSKGRFVKRYILKYPLIKITEYDESFVVRIGPGHHYIGSNGYRAPEVVLGPSWSFGVDVFSFGCLLAELHVGKPIFRPTSTKLGFLLQLRHVLGGLSTSFLMKLKATGNNSLLTTTNELRTAISEAEFADAAGCNYARPLAVLISRPDLFNVLQLALAGHDAARPTARLLMTHSYFQV